MSRKPAAAKLLAVLVTTACVPILPAQKGAAHAAVDAVIVGSVREADQVAAGLGHGVGLRWVRVLGKG